jgi:hypothetical protein
MKKGIFSELRISKNIQFSGYTELILKVRYYDPMKIFCYGLFLEDNQVLKNFRNNELMEYNVLNIIANY